VTLLHKPVAVNDGVAESLPGHGPTKRRKSTWRRVIAVLGWVAVLAIVVAAWPVRFGGHLGLTVVSGQSMAGTYQSGDLVATWRTGDYAVGDVIVYRIPDGGPGEGLRVVHRVVEKRSDGSYRTQGDNSEYADPWVPTEPDIDGRVVVAVPGAGTWLTWLVSPWALVLLAAGCLAAWVFRLVDGD